VRGRLVGFGVGFLVGAVLVASLGASTQFSAPIMEALRTLGWVSADSVHTRWSKSFLWPGGAYLNLGTVYGSTGYGFRDNAGVMQVKSSAGAWANVVSGTGATGATCTAFVNGVCTVASDDDVVATVRALEARLEAMEQRR